MNQAKSMNIVIFAGGAGTRLWPLSRKATPKQFGKVIGDQSTLQRAVNRLHPDFQVDKIYIATSDRYVSLVHDQLPAIPKEQVIGEPAVRDVGPAVGLLTAILAKYHADRPMAILWSDHLVGNESLFRQILAAAQKVIEADPNCIVFIGQKPRFASQNLGWIEYGKTLKKIDGISIREFRGTHYRPDITKAREFFASGHHAWNLGYFVTTPRFLLRQYQKFVPKMHPKITKIASFWGDKDFSQVLKKEYPSIESVHFDEAILEKLDPKQAVVITENLKWSDVGAWEALKEALQKHPSQNITQGKVLLTDCRDSLVYNYTDQLSVAIDLDGFFIVNTDDVLLVCRKDSVPKIKTLVNSFTGTENERLS